MYALLQRKHDKKYFVGHHRSRKSQSPNVSSVVHCNDNAALREISSNLNHNVPQIRVSPVDKVRVDKRLDEASLTPKPSTESESNRSNHLTNVDQLADQSLNINQTLRREVLDEASLTEKSSTESESNRLNHLTNVDQLADQSRNINPTLRREVLDFDIIPGQCETTSQSIEISPPHLGSSLLSSASAFIVAEAESKTDDPREDFFENRGTNDEKKDDYCLSGETSPICHDHNIVPSDDIVATFVDVWTQPSPNVSFTIIDSVESNDSNVLHQPDGKILKISNMKSSDNDHEYNIKQTSTAPVTEASGQSSTGFSVKLNRITIQSDSDEVRDCIPEPILSRQIQNQLMNVKQSESTLQRHIIGFEGPIDARRTDGEIEAISSVEELPQKKFGIIHNYPKKHCHVEEACTGNSVQVLSISTNHSNTHDEFLTALQLIKTSVVAQVESKADDTEGPLLEISAIGVDTDCAINHDHHIVPSHNISESSIGVDAKLHPSETLDVDTAFDGVNLRLKMIDTSDLGVPSDSGSRTVNVTPNDSKGPDETAQIDRNGFKNLASYTFDENDNESGLGILVQESSRLRNMDAKSVQESFVIIKNVRSDLSQDSSGLNESSFMPGAHENDMSNGSLETPNKLNSMSFLMEDDDDDWLPGEVQYTMNTVLEQILSTDGDKIGEIEETGRENPINFENNESSSENEENADVENMRASTSYENYILSPFIADRTSNEIVSLPNLSAETNVKKSTRKTRTLLFPMNNTSDTDGSDNDNVADKDYNPTDDSNHSGESGSDMNDSNVSKGRKKNESLSEPASDPVNISNVLNISNKAAASGAPDDTKLVVQTSDNKISKKKYFCVYCQKRYSKLPRHLEHVHSKEEDVKKFSALPPGSEERRKVLDVLRKTGTFQFNTDAKFNTGEIITSRRPDPKYQKKGSDYKTCVKCLGTYSVLNIRHHVAACNKGGPKYERSVIILGRTIEGRVHKEASDKLRLEVFPPLREDDVVRLIRYDRLLIIWGNKLCLRYSAHYQHKGIRSRLRRMGKVLLTAKILNQGITDCASMYNPKVYDDVVQAVRITARYNEKEGEFEAPSVGMNVGTYIKQIGAILANEYVKSEEPEKERKVEQFLKIFKVDFSADVNNAALATQRKNRRQRKVILPSTDDIRTLSNYVNSEMKFLFKNLSETYSFEEWFKLSQLVMIAIVTFNRRRVGEIENILVKDYTNPEKIDEQTDHELYRSLSAEAKAIANRYVRITIRGKLDRPVRLLLLGINTEAGPIQYGLFSPVRCQYPALVSMGQHREQL